MVAYILGVLLLIEAFLLIFPLITALIYSEPVMPFLASIGILGLVGGLLRLIGRTKNKTIYAREGFLIVSLGWILLSAMGALPFFISGEIPNYIDALFETTSGFTTTGSSILTNVEALSKSLIFWRSFTHWVGGMGVLVFIMAAIPLAGGGGNIHLLKAESPGPEVSKLVPKAKHTALILYLIYFVMTVVLVAIMLLDGNSLFDSLTLSFGTAGTGGFGIKNDSMASYSASTQTIITIGMAAFGVNFNCYYYLINKRFKECFGNEELKYYLLIMVGAILFITFNSKSMYSNIGESLHHAAFQVSSVMTTTGYTTVNYDFWPSFSKTIMLGVMCVGACAGSTGGGIKVSRIVIMARYAKNEVLKAIHPNKVTQIRFNGRVIDNETIRGINAYIIIYIAVFAVSLLIVSLDNKDMVSNISGVIATLNNIGPGLESVGATGNFASFSALSKCVFIFDMIAGRLELFPIMMLFYPRSWIKK